MLQKMMQKYNQDRYTFVISDSLYHAFLREKSAFEIKNQIPFMFKVIKSSDFLSILSFKEHKELILKMVDDGVLPSSAKKQIEMAKYDIKRVLLQTNVFLQKYQKHLTFPLNALTFYQKQTLIFLNHIENFEPLLTYHQLDFIIEKLEYSHTPKIVQYKHIQDELADVFEKIAHLLHIGADINKILIANVDQAHYDLLKKIARFYHIPLQLPSQTTYMDLPLTKKILEQENLIMFFQNEEAIDSLKFEFLYMEDDLFYDVIETIIDLLNQYEAYKYENNVLKITLKHDLSLKTVRTKKQTGQLCLIRFEELLLLDETYDVFVINAYHEHFPILKKDNDIISDEQKVLIGLMDSSSQNAMLQKFYKSLCYHKTIKQISYAQRDHNQTYQISDLILHFNNNSSDFRTLDIDEVHINFAPLFYRQYFKNKNKGIKLTTFSGDFNLSRLERETLSHYLTQAQLKLSASGISTYLKVPFIFYLNQVLKLKNFEDNIYLRSGNFFHILVEIVMAIRFKSEVYESQMNDGWFLKMIEEFKSKAFNLEMIFDEVFKVFFKDDLTIYDLHQMHLDRVDSSSQLSIETIYFMLKNKGKIMKALSFLIDINEAMVPEKLMLEYPLSTRDFIGFSDMVRLNQNPALTFSIIDYKTSVKKAFNPTHIMDFLNQLSLDYDASVETSYIDLIQILFYAHFISLAFKDYSLLDVSYFSYLEENLSLNSLSTQVLDPSIYTSSSKRMLADDDLKQYDILLENVIYETKSRVYDARFEKRIRQSANGKKRLSFKDFNQYKALAYFSKYEINDSDEDENDDQSE